MYARTIDVKILNDSSARSLHQGYKYILKDSLPFMAFKNDEELNYFLEATGQSIVPYEPDNFKRFVLEYPVHDTLFSFLSDIKDLDKATKFSDLSNGEYVACYTYIEGGICHIFRPNPNYEDVYTLRGKMVPIERPVSFTKDVPTYEFTVTLPKGKLPEDIKINIHFKPEDDL